MTFTLDEYDEIYKNLEDGYEIREVEAQGGVRQFEVVKTPEPTQEELNAIEVTNLKDYLASTDYVVIKIAEGVANKEEYADVLSQRVRTRQRINELE